MLIEVESSEKILILIYSYMYCVYLTSYFGNKLPMFYIGSSSISKVNNGYHGSVKSKKYKSIYECELKNNPHLFKTRIISIHKLREDAIQKEYKLQKQLNVSISSIYFNECYASRFFGQRNAGKNNGFYGRKHTEETLQKMRKPKSEQTKSKMRKPKSEQHRLKIIQANNGKYRDYSKKDTCVHCGKQAMKTNITRWHNDNCKSLGEEIL